MMAAAAPTSPTPGLRRILARFWPHIRPQGRLIATAAFAMFAGIAFRLLEPWPLKFVFDRVIDVGSGPRWTGMAPMKLVAWCAIALVVVAAGRAVCVYFGRVGFALAGNRILTRSRGELFSHMQRLSLTFHDDRRTGDLVTRVTGDIGRLKEVAVTAMLPLAVHAVTFVAMMVVMFWMDWVLALAALGVLPLFALSTTRIGRRIHGVAKKQRRREGLIGATTAEAMTSIKLVQTLSIEDVQQATFANQNQSSLRDGVKMKKLSARLVGTVDVLVAIATGVVLYLGAQRVLQEALTPGDLIVMLTYLKNAFKPMKDVAKYAARVAAAMAAAQRVVEILDAVPAVQDRADAVAAPSVVKSIAFRDVSFGYEAGRTALEGVSFTAERGQLIALAGASGAGKTTIANLLLRLYDPDEGEICFDGADIRAFGVDSLRRTMAIVPQTNVLFAASVGANIAYGAIDATSEDVIEAATLARADEFIQRMPNGYDTMVGERGSTLSEGQKHRVAIARAAIRRAPILILDEPAASLDAVNTAHVRASLQDLRRDRIVIVIAHDLALAEDADEILVLDAGRIVERGSHTALLASGGAYAGMWGTQHASIERETHAFRG